MPAASLRRAGPRAGRPGSAPRPPSAGSCRRRRTGSGCERGHGRRRAPRPGRRRCGTTRRRSRPRGGGCRGLRSRLPARMPAAARRATAAGSRNRPAEWRAARNEVLRNWTSGAWRRWYLQPMRLVSAWFRIPFWQRVLAGFVLGALAGWIVGPASETWFGPFGDLYVTLIKLIAAPLVFFAVIHAVSSLHGQKSMVALGGRTFAWFAGTAVLAVGVGLLVGTVLQPGIGVGALSIASDYVPKTVPDPIQVLMDVVPANAFYALTGIGQTTNAAGETVLAAGKGSILPVIFIAALLGFAMVKLGDRVAMARKLAGEASELMIQVTRFVLEVTPIGTFGLIAALVGSYGFEKLLPLGSFVIALYLACVIQIVFVYGGLLLSHGLIPLKFFRGAASGMQVAFVSSSSFASMPAALRSVTHNLGVDRDYAAFAVPLGAS